MPQPRGEGALSRVIEPTTQRGYWLYLPKEYVLNTDAFRRTRHWPLVLTFHGMKPFDNSHMQAREWEREADRYGYIVVAPELRSMDLLAPFPVRTVHPAFESDARATLAIMDDVIADTLADHGNVLATSWSSGGYLAHYLFNRHPHRFTCLAVRQSNFSEHVLDPDAAAPSLNRPILIVDTENDFAVCQRESEAAREWYRAHRYENVTWLRIKGLGHERTPDVAADFFASVTGCAPKPPVDALVRRRFLATDPGPTDLPSGQRSSATRDDVTVGVQQ